MVVGTATVVDSDLVVEFETASVSVSVAVAVSPWSVRVGEVVGATDAVDGSVEEKFKVPPLGDRISKGPESLVTFVTTPDIGSGGSSKQWLKRAKL